MYAYSHDRFNIFKFIVIISEIQIWASNNS